MTFTRVYLQGLATKGELVILIDAGQTGSANTALMFSVLCMGFAIPLALAVKRGEKGHNLEEMQLDLLKTPYLSQRLPSGAFGLWRV